jgi:DNA-directed RNA polymerase specialized sigma24 family protein
MNYIKDNNMFTIVYINKETIELKQDYLYELEDRTTINDQLKKDYLIENLYKSLEILTPKQKRRVISYYLNNESIEEIALKEKVSESAIRKSIHQSLIQLKRKLNKYK